MTINMLQTQYVISILPQVNSYCNHLQEIYIQWYLNFYPKFTAGANKDGSEYKIIWLKI